MICNKCQQGGKESKVFEGSETVTLVGGGDFYDEQGKHHFHDPNCHVSHHSCSNGHNFSVRHIQSCWCGWRQDESCFCHPKGQRHT